MMHVNTVNRFSLAREPHVYLWGVGFLPRRWQAPYVRWRRDASFENIGLLSYRELRRLGGACFPHQRIDNQDVDDQSLRQFSSFTRGLVAGYRFAKTMPLLSWFFNWFGPGWEADFFKQPAHNCNVP
jgi:hypothetical protein